MEPRALQYEQTLVREAEPILEEYAPGPLLLVTPGARGLGAYPYPPQPSELGKLRLKGQRDWRANGWKAACRFLAEAGVGGVACRGQGHQVLMPSVLPFTSPTHIFFARPAHHLNPSQHPTTPTQNRSHH